MAGSENNESELIMRMVMFVFVCMSLLTRSHITPLLVDPASCHMHHSSLWLKSASEKKSSHRRKTGQFYTTLLTW